MTRAGQDLIQIARKNPFYFSPQKDIKQYKHPDADNIIPHDDIALVFWLSIYSRWKGTTRAKGWNWKGTHRQREGKKIRDDIWRDSLFFCVAFFLFCQYIYIVHVQLVIYSLQSRGPYRSIEGHRAFCFLLDISSHTGSFASALLLLYSRPSHSEYKVHTSEKSQSAISTNRDLIFPFAPFFLSFLFALYQINSRKLYLVYRTRLQKKK